MDMATLVPMLATQPYSKFFTDPETRTRFKFTSHVQYELIATGMDAFTF